MSGVKSNLSLNNQLGFISPINYRASKTNTATLAKKRSPRVSYYTYFATYPSKRTIGVGNMDFWVERIIEVEDYVKEQDERRLDIILLNFVSYLKKCKISTFFSK